MSEAIYSSKKFHGDLEHLQMCRGFGEGPKK